MNKDNYGEIINGEETYKFIKEELCKNYYDVIIGWTDGELDHRDIYFSYRETK